MSRRNLRAGGLALLLVAALLFALLDPTRVARSEPPAAEITQVERAVRVNWRVIDGDTFEDLDSGDRYRLENVDTPETGPRARCTAERELGDRATRQASTFITSARQLEVRRTGRIDRYDRIIAFVRIDGRDLGELMISAGLARPWRGRREPWCDSRGNLVP